MGVQSAGNSQGLQLSIIYPPHPEDTHYQFSIKTRISNRETSAKFDVFEILIYYYCYERELSTMRFNLGRPSASP